MAYKVWRAGDDIAIEVGDSRIVLSVADAEKLARELPRKAETLSTKQRHALLEKLWKTGASRSEIMSATGYKAATINQFRIKLGLAPRRPPMPDHVQAAMKAGRERLRAVK